jgi:hypothetical protein
LNAFESNQFEYLVDTATGDAVGLRETEQMVVRTSATVDGADVKYRTDVMKRLAKTFVLFSFNGD